MKCDDTKRFAIFFKCDMIMMGMPHLNLFSTMISRNAIAKFLLMLRMYELTIALSKSTRKIHFVAKIMKPIVGGYFKHLSMKLGFTIPPYVFGPGLRIPHYGTIVVNHNAKVGACCVLHTGTCIAGTEEKIIGNALYLSTGAVIAGPIILGDNTTVGANSFVNSNFPMGFALIAGAPAKQIKKRPAWYKLEGDSYNEKALQVFHLLERNSMSSSLNRE